MEPPTLSRALMEAMIELPLLKSTTCSACPSIRVGDALSKLVTDQPSGFVVGLYEKNSMEYVVRWGGKELMIIDLRDLTLQSWTMNIWGV